jgi:hypothetical protein
MTMTYAELQLFLDRMADLKNRLDVPDAEYMGALFLEALKALRACGDPRTTDDILDDLRDRTLALLNPVDNPSDLGEDLGDRGGKLG